MIIGISGKIATGKTTTAEKLLRKINRPAIIKSFGDFLKEEIADMYGFPLEWCYSQEGKLRKIPGANISVRKALQIHGVMRREQDKDYWVNKMRDFYKTERRGYDNLEDLVLIIDDVRFSNEAMFCKTNGMLVRIHPYKGWEPSEFAGHISETALDGYRLFDQQFMPLYGELDYVADCILTFAGLDEEFIPGGA